MDEIEFREVARSKVLSMKGSKPRPQTPDKPETIYFIGTVILAEPQFCYVVVDRAMVKNGFSYETTLQDGSVVSLSYSDFLVAEKGELAAFFIYRNVVDYNVDMISAVEFAEEEVNRFGVVWLGDFEFAEEEVNRFGVVWLGDFDGNRNIFVPGGRVNTVEGHFFMFDCSTSGDTKNGGAPVFNEACTLAGICYQCPMEPAYAHTLNAIKANLFKLSEVPVQTLQEFLDVQLM